MKRNRFWSVLHPKLVALTGCASLVLASLFVKSCVNRGSFETQDPQGTSEASQAANPVSTKVTASLKDSFAEENMSVFFSLSTKDLDKAQSTAQVLSALRPQMPTLDALISSATYQNLLKSVVAKTTDHNPLEQGVDTEILKIPLQRWFVTGLRFDICDFSTKVPNDWVLDLPENLLWQICTQTIRLVVQPFGFRRENTPSGVQRNAWASDDKTFHFIFTFRGSQVVPTNLKILGQRSAFDQKVNGLVQSGSLSKKAFADLAASHFSDTSHESASLDLRNQFARLINSERTSKKGGKLTLPFSSGEALLSYKSFVEKRLTPLADLRVVTHMFSSTGLEPSSDNTWAFGQNRVQAQASPVAPGASFSRDELNFYCVNHDGSVIQDKVTQGHNETFSQLPGDAFSLDGELVANGEKSDSCRYHLLFQTAARAFLREDNKKLVGDWENTSENPPPPPLVSMLKLAFERSESVRRSSIGTQPCISCHIAPGQREVLGIPKPKEEILAGNRQADTNLITEQSKPNNAWNIRQFGYFGRSPSIGTRLVLETRQQLDLANRVRNGL